jgi:hypothetical protein
MIANRKHDLIAIRISDPRESKLENFGMIDFEDAETGEIITVDTADLLFRKDFSSRATELNEKLEKAFRRINLDYIQLTTGQDYIFPLSAFFKQRERRYRR